MSGESFTQGVRSPDESPGQAREAADSSTSRTTVRPASPQWAERATPAAASHAVGVGGFLTVAGALLRATRPLQWVKNVLVFAGVVFSRQFTDPAAVQASVLACGLFVLASGGIYLVNDVLDADADRRHPVKRLRPVAAGALPPQVAVGAAVLLLAAALAGAFSMQVVLGAILALYVGVNLAYSVWLKHVPLLDASLVATGFALRAAAGTVAVLTPISPWLYICTLLLALLLILGKRRRELALLGARAAEHRPNLAHYTAEALDRWLVVAASATAVAYVLYSLFSPATSGSPVLLVTVPFVIVGLVRYLRATRSAGGAESPEALLFRDPWLLASVALWGLTVLALLSLANGWPA